MIASEIIDTLISKLAIPGGRHLYGVLGSYSLLDDFAKELQQARTAEDILFPAPISANKGILDMIPDDDFRELIQNEAKRPEPTAKHVAKAFEQFLRSNLKTQGLLVMAHLEMIFAYNLDLNLLRTMAADDYRIVLLLPGQRSQGRIIMFPGLTEGSYTLPTNLIAENHLWELSS